MSARPIHCGIHGTISLSPLAQTIIYTPEFERLSRIRQLGVCHKIYPSAEHTRYSHSIGVYHLATLLATSILLKYPDREFPCPELGGQVRLSQRIVDLIGIAGLCHDIGHGPFSHTFDEKIFGHSSHPLARHEARSCLIFEKIATRELKDLSPQEIEFVKVLIDPPESYARMGVLYQIVSNPLNGIDVDKWDYLVRDSKSLGISLSFNYERLLSEFIVDQNDNIAYPMQSRDDVYQLFYSRFRMHSRVYSHHSVKVIEEMLGDLISHLNLALGIFDIEKLDLDSFLNLDDSSFQKLVTDYRTNFMNFRDRLLPEAGEHMTAACVITSRIICKDLYHEVEEGTPGAKMIEHSIGYSSSKNPVMINFYDRGTFESSELSLLDLHPLSNGITRIVTRLWVLQ